MAKTRIYEIEAIEQMPYLVEATSAAAAEKHVARKFIKEASIASTLRVAELMGQGVKVERAEGGE